MAFPRGWRVIDEVNAAGRIISAVVRDDVMIANDNLRIEQGDHVIMFLTDKKFVPTSNVCFQPSPFLHSNLRGSFSALF